MKIFTENSRGNSQKIHGKIHGAETTIHRKFKAKLTLNSQRILFGLERSWSYDSSRSVYIFKSLQDKFFFTVLLLGERSS